MQTPKKNDVCARAFKYSVYISNKIKKKLFFFFFFVVLPHSFIFFFFTKEKKFYEYDMKLNIYEAKKFLVLSTQKKIEIKWGKEKENRRSLPLGWLALRSRSYIQFHTMYILVYTIQLENDLNTHSESELFFSMVLKSAHGNRVSL